MATISLTINKAFIFRYVSNHMNLTREQREKKAFKILYGHQIIHIRGTDLYFVESESNPDVYYETSDKTCTCPYHTAYQEPCKHMIAVEYALQNEIFPMEMIIEQINHFIQQHSQHKKDMQLSIIEKTTKIATKEASRLTKMVYEKKFEELKSKLNEKVTKLKDEVEDLKAKKKEVKLSNRTKVLVRKSQKCNPKKLTYKDDKYGF